MRRLNSYLVAAAPSAAAAAATATVSVSHVSSLFLSTRRCMSTSALHTTPSLLESSKFKNSDNSAQRQPEPQGEAAATFTNSTTSTESAAAADTFSIHCGNATSIAPGPYRRVGNILIVSCVDHPFKFSWEVNRMLRDLRLEFMGQTTIVPDIPEVRKRLWRVRHVVRVDQLDLDEAKALVGIPEHVSFSDLNAQLPATFGRGKGRSSPVIRSKHNFMRYRRMRLRDVLHRDQLEKKLLEEKRRVLAAQQQQQQLSGAKVEGAGSA